MNDRLVTALQTPGKQLVVYGHSGSGKTTLLVNKLQQLYERHITTRCMRGVTLEAIVLDAFDQLAPLFEAQSTSSTSVSQSAQLSAQYASIKAQVGRAAVSQRSRTLKRALPPQLIPQALGRLLGASGCCWVLEDFHKVEGEHKVKVAQMMKVFMDMADEYAHLKIVALGAVDTARQVIECDPEMRNRVAEIGVPLMGGDELGEIILRGSGLLGVEMWQAVRFNIVKYSSGLAATCHQLCLNACIEAGVEVTAPQLVEIGKQEFDRAVKRYLEEASDTLKAAFSQAFRRKRVRRYDNGRLIIAALSECDAEGATHSQILAKIRRREPSYPAANLTQYLQQLRLEENGGLVRHDAQANTYAFADPLYRAFGVSLFEKQNRQSRDALFENHNISVVFEQLQTSMFNFVVKWGEARSTESGAESEK